MSNEIILIVNDDDDISSLFADALQIEGFKTIKSNNASLALEEIELRPDEFVPSLWTRQARQETLQRMSKVSIPVQKLF